MYTWVYKRKTPAIRKLDPKSKQKECIHGYTNVKHRRTVLYVFTTQAPASNTSQTMSRNVITHDVCIWNLERKENSAQGHAKPGIWR